MRFLDHVFRKQCVDVGEFAFNFEKALGDLFKKAF
jgi:hypothetical protein